jgi:hypothetical protein
VADDLMEPPAYRIEHRRAGEAGLILGFCDDADRPQISWRPSSRGF